MRRTPVNALNHAMVEEINAAHRLACDSFMRVNGFDDRRAIENVVDTVCDIIETDDAQEELRAMNKKRRPNWQAAGEKP